MYKEIKQLLLKFGIKLETQDTESLYLLKVVLNYKRGVFNFNSVKKNKLKKKTILIADGNKNLSDLLKELLTDLFKVEQVFNEDEICNKVKKVKPFLLVLDNDLLCNIKTELLPKLRKNFQNEMKIILYSSKNISQLKRENKVKNIDVDGYFQKPRSLESLLGKIIDLGLLSIE